NDPKGIALPERIDQRTGSGRVVQILHRYWKIADGKRDGRAHEDQLHQRQKQREAQRHFVPDNLRQFLACLCQNSSHVAYSSTATLPCCRAFSTTPINTSSSEKRPSRTLITRMPADSSLCR